MAKTLKRYVATYVDVKRADGSEYPSLEYRTWYVGRTGVLSLMESDDKAPGQKFIRFQCADPNEYITTSYGELNEEDEAIIVRTHNSIYTFEKIESL